NEALFRYLFTQGLARSRRQKEMLALMLVDLDRFQEVRKQSGDKVADGILRQIADRLRRNVREGDTVARVGDDEFVWSISNLLDMEDLAIIAEKMLGIARRPIQIDGRDYQITASIGIGVYPYDSGETDMLMQHAVTALIRAKELGRDTYQFYTEELNSRLRERLALKRQLHDALAKHEFVLHYQPVLSVSSQRVDGLEALLRWKNPDGKLAYPEEFLKVSEDTGLIAPLDEWVLRTACQQMQKWAGVDGGAALFLTVNISRKLFQQMDFPLKVASILRETGFPPQRLELEVQEGTLTSDIERSVLTARSLRELGVRLSIDDFGTGALSLNQMKLLPLTTVKIDPAFTRNLPEDVANASVVAGMISLAHTMGFRVVAEGLEQEAELKYLRSLKCDLFQGHLFRPPVPVENIADILRTERAEFDVEIPLDIEEEALFDDPLRTMTMPISYVPPSPLETQRHVVVAPAVTAEAVVRHAISKTYFVTCAACSRQFDAMIEGWCTCLVTERTLVCPHCMDCFCKAPLEFKLDFWTEAPQGMWDRRLQEEGRFRAVKANPLASLAKRPLVLVLDDERPILAMAAQLIESLGYGVVTGANGEEGLALARSYKPDLVLSDALMPRMDGREMCRKIKTDPQLSKTKVIIMTSLSTRPRDRSTAFKEFRMDEYLQKPLAFKDLRKVLEKLLS
ncbi:MAG TPA: EAL domain-containing protein, partial [Acidobacteriota bacterium]|nr:EAL domain-containing protein [Acidobacteriota bacterium]